MKQLIKMLIKPCEKYISDLADLWHEVFGDDYSYINLLFNSEFYLCDTFVKEEGGRIISVLYLLNCNISFEGEKYKGKYLYAAATSPQYRGKGYMAELIKEAQTYCENQGVDFVSLVPADEHLYSYYSKFGFVTAMHRCETRIKKLSRETVASLPPSECIGTDDVYKIRTSFKGNYFSFEKDDLQYAIDCIVAGGGKIYPVSTESYFIADKEMKTAEEFISSKENFSDNFKKMLSYFKGDVKVYSPYSTDSFGETEINKFGMIYPINKKLKRDWSFDDIYMNLALD